MIKKIIEKIKELNSKKMVELENFKKDLNDEIALKTDFTPLKRWWANFQTHKLIYDDFWNIILKSKLFFWLMFLIWFSSPLILTLINLKTDFNIELLTSENIINIIIWFIFFGLWLFVFYLTNNSKIFDFQNWYFYPLKYKKRIWEYINTDRKKDKIIKISDIYALQIIKERVSWNKSSYNSYEINAILKDSSRINIIDHWSFINIKKDSEELSKKLWNIQVWDNTR